MFDEIDDISEEHYCGRSAFRLYSDRLSKIRSLTEDERRSLHYRGCNRELWTDAMRLVLFVFHKLKKIGYLTYIQASDMDVVQIGNIAAGEAIGKWNPDKGKFSTYLYPYIRGAMLNFAADEARWAGLLKSRAITAENSSEEIPDEWDTGVDDLPPNEVDGIPDGAQNGTQSDDAAYDAAIAAEIHEALNSLPRQMRQDILLRYYFNYSISELADNEDVSDQRMYVRLRSAISRFQDIWLNNSGIS